jgi:hypothetical protein
MVKEEDSSDEGSVQMQRETRLTHSNSYLMEFQEEIAQEKRKRETMHFMNNDEELTAKITLSV